MLGRESAQHSFLDAAWSAESLLEEDGFYGTLYREGPRLYSDDFFAECYTLDNGRPSVPPSRMMKVVLLQHWEGLSDRRALERMAFDLRWKAVLGMEVGEPAVAQSTLVEFRARLQLHDKMEEAFGRFLEHAIEAELIDPEEAQVIDSSGIWGRGAVEDTYNLIASAAGKVLRAAAEYRKIDPEMLATEAGVELVAPADGGSLKGRAEIDWSDEAQRRGFLNAVVSEARTLLAETRDDQAASADVSEAAGLLARILCQDLEPVPDEDAEDEGGDGEPELELLSEPPAAPEPEGEGAEETAPEPVLTPGQEVRIWRGVATDRIVSAHDPEMRHGRKSQQRKWDGYKGHFSVSADSEFVTEVEVTAANVGDAEAASGLLEAHRRRGLEPVAVVGDMAYSAAELRAIARAEGTEICARLPPTPAPGGRFSKDRFTLDLEAGVATCPAGRTTSRTHRRGEGSQFVFDGAACAACDLRTQCTSKAPEKMRATGMGRTVSVHPRESLLQEARAREESEDFRELHAKRSVVERKIAHLMRRGLRQARYFGVRKTRFQALATALVANLARMATLSGARAGQTGPALAAA